MCTFSKKFSWFWRKCSHLNGDFCCCHCGFIGWFKKEGGGRVAPLSSGESVPFTTSTCAYFYVENLGENSIIGRKTRTFKYFNDTERNYKIFIADLFERSNFTTSLSIRAHFDSKLAFSLYLHTRVLFKHGCGPDVPCRGRFARHPWKSTGPLSSAKMQLSI